MGFASRRRIDDPRSQQVVAALEAVGAGRSTVQLPQLSASFRDELRTQLVAVTPRLVAEGVRPGTETPARATRTSRRATSPAAAPAPRAAIRTRPMTVLVAGAAVVVLGLGGATWLARGALPGDALYGLKRTAEGVDVSLSGSDLDKGHALLVGAQKRVEEVGQLISRPQSMSLGYGATASGTLNDATAKLVVSTLATADTETQQGVTTIGDDAVRTGEVGGLELVVGWAGGETGKGGQIGRIAALVDDISPGPAHDSAAASLANIDTAYGRAQDLLPEITDGVTCARGRDAFGPKPCGVVTTTPTAPSQPSTPTTPGPGATTTNPGGGATTAPTGGPATTSGAPPPPTSAPASPSASASPRATRTTPTPAVAANSCGVQVNLPVATVSLGTCPPGR